MDIQAQTKLAQMDASELSRVYMRIFNTDDGKLILEDLRNRCFAYVPTAIGDNIYFNEGKRSVVLHIETQLRPEPAQEKPETNEDET